MQTNNEEKKIEIPNGKQEQGHDKYPYPHPHNILTPIQGSYEHICRFNGCRQYKIR